MCMKKNKLKLNEQNKKTKKTKMKYSSVDHHLEEKVFLHADCLSVGEESISFSNVVKTPLDAELSIEQYIAAAVISI